MIQKQIISMKTYVFTNIPRQNTVKNCSIDGTNVFTEFYKLKFVKHMASSIEPCFFRNLPR